MFLFLLACSPSTPPLTLAGSSTIRPLAEVAAERFEAAHPGQRVSVQGGGSGVGVSAARSGLADIGMVSRSLKDDEADLEKVTIARDGIALIAHASRAGTTLTTQQVFDIYTGVVSTWPDGAPITVVNKEEGRSTRELFEHHFHIERFRDDLVVIGPNGQAISTVASDPDALAYVSIGSAAQAEADGIPVRRLGVDGIAATVASVRDGSWPLSRELNLVTHGAPGPVAAEFIAFLGSPAGQALVVAEDFVPVADVAP
ncbi:MAG: phosphate ABC transporter substrate-binding protein [Myxococcota bacterium]